MKMIYVLLFGGFSGNRWWFLHGRPFHDLIENFLTNSEQQPSIQVDRQLYPFLSYQKKKYF